MPIRNWMIYILYLDDIVYLHMDPEPPSLAAVTAPLLG